MSDDRAQRQRAIGATDRSFVVEASAGTGKTSILVQRILHFVLERGPGGLPLPITRICAITFTEKAAGEMKIRLRQEFERRASVAGEAGALARQALVDLESAAISTFHSFAVSLLKERPIEAGLDPRFTALDDIQSELFFQEVWEAWLQRVIQERRPALEQALRKGLGLPALRSVARTIRLHAHSVRQLKLPAPPTEEETRKHLAELLEKGRALLPMAQDPGDKLLPLLDDALSWIADPSSEVRLAKPGPKGAAANWKGGKETVEEVRDFLRTSVEFSSMYRLLPFRRALDAVLRLILGEFLPEWEARKRAQGFLDFDDQLWCAYELLSSSNAARAEFRERHAAYLVDEFQDTDPVQWEIIRLLASSPDASGTGDETIAPGRLFIVGDPKQSIYRFRGADIETYGKVADPASMEKLGLERLELTANFRSVPSVLRFADEAFGDIMTKAEGKPYQPAYLAFGGRGARAGKPLRTCVHLLGDRRADGSPAGSGPEFFRFEAKRVARLIMSICGSADWEVEQTGQQEPVWRVPRFRDIAILLPVLTRADALEEALRAAEIPYVLEGGKFYYARNEVSSAINILRSIANPNDGVALYGALRSIFFGVSDEDLLRARMEGFALDYRTEIPAGSKLNRPCRILGELHLRRHERSASETLEFLLQQTGAREVLALHGAQSLANLNKLVRTLRSLQRNATFSEVVELVGSMDEEGIAESESRIMEEHSDAVRILSIHRAKGLDFPIVIVAGLGIMRQSRHADFLEDSHGQKIFGLRAGSRESGFRTPGWESLAEVEKAKEEAELIRLLYVALTRARDHLILCTHTRGKKIPGSEQWAPGFESTRLKPLGPFLATLPDQEGLPVNFIDSGSLDKADGRPTSEKRLPEKSWEAALATQYQELRRLLSETPQARGLRTAATEVEAGAKGETAGDTAQDRAIRIGIAFHEAMDEVDFDDFSDIGRPAHAAGVRQKLDGSGIEVLEEMLDRSLKSPLMDRVRCARRDGGRVWREIPYVRPLNLESADFEIEEGKMDLLFEEADGWVLVDYKTDHITEGGVDAASHFTGKYAGQLRTYISALQALGVKVKSACLLLARTGEHFEIPAD